MKWALVLSGGGAKGLPYIGLLKVFEELNIPKPSLIVGCSIGAVIGSMYAIGKSSKEIERCFTVDFDQGDYLGAGNIFSTKAFNMMINAGTFLSNLLSGNSIDDGHKIYTFIRRLTDGKNFSDTKIPFVCNALDLHSGREVILRNGELAKSVLASSAYPIMLKPVRIGDKLLVDGGVAHNTPVWIAESFGYKKIVSVTLDHFKTTSFPTRYANAPSLYVRLITCMLNKQKLTKKDYPSFWIDLSNDIDSIDFSNTRDKITFGYKLALEQKEQISKFFDSGVQGTNFRKNVKLQVEKNYRL